MLRIIEGDYAYSSSLIRAVELKLLNSGHFDRMLDAQSTEEAFKVLIEAGYGFGDTVTDSIYAFETLLAEEMEKTYLLLEEIAPQTELIKAFQRRFDYFNVKVILKAEFLGQEVPALLISTGNIDKDTLVRIIRERDYDELTPVMKQAIEETFEMFAKTKDPQMVDIILDKASYRQLTADLKDIDSPFLHELADTIIDITNIKMYIRARLLNKMWDFIGKILLEGGTIPREVYSENSDKAVDVFINELEPTRYGNEVRKGWEHYSTNRNVLGLEKLLDNYLLTFIGGAKMVVMGVEPLVAYIYAKEAEIKNARIVMTGKINGLSADSIRERLRLLYV